MTARGSSGCCCSAASLLARDAASLVDARACVCSCCCCSGCGLEVPLVLLVFMSHSVAVCWCFCLDSLTCACHWALVCTRVLGPVVVLAHHLLRNGDPGECVCVCVGATIWNCLVQPALVAFDAMVKEKVALVCVMELASQRPPSNKSIPFSDIASATRLPLDQVCCRQCALVSPVRVAPTTPSSSNCGCAAPCLCWNTWM